MTLCRILVSAMLLAVMARGTHASEASAPLEVPSEGLALWRAAIDAYFQGDLIDALQKLKWYRQRVEKGATEWHPTLVTYLRIQCAADLGHFEKVYDKLDRLNIHELPPPLRYRADLLQWERSLADPKSAAVPSSSVNPDEVPPMADARLAIAKGMSQEQNGNIEEALELYARGIVLAAPEDHEETQKTIQRAIELLTISERGEEATRLTRVLEAVYGQH